ncbi:secreted RxLR effector protein 161-like [Rosa chinensis]|uniref:secreted RxLR effector protein 161-like n=1 Tax=Rosa chinensis TaxID=74649 RepID=UPI001AD94A4E|nr:secreted RxLR effector protein 161-like [Rosa chinensis]
MESCAPGDVPMSKEDKFSKNSKNGGKSGDMESRPYARLIGSLMYAQVCTRPDLSFAIGILSRLQSNSSHQHWVAGKKVLRYLQRTKSHVLVYRKVENLKLLGYTDSDFAGNYPSSMKSTCGYVFMLVGIDVAWKTMKQKLIGTSTMQAEFIAVYEGVYEGLWIKNFLMQTEVLKSIVSGALKAFCDNEAVI